MKSVRLLVQVSLAVLLFIPCMASGQIEGGFNLADAVRGENDIAALEGEFEKRRTISKADTDRAAMNDVLFRLLWSLPECPRLLTYSRCGPAEASDISLLKKTLETTANSLQLENAGDRARYVEAIDEFCLKAKGYCEEASLKRLAVMACKLSKPDLEKHLVPSLFSRNFQIRDKSFEATSWRLISELEDSKSKDLNSGMEIILKHVPEKSRSLLIAMMKSKFQLANMPAESTREDVEAALMTEILSTIQMPSDELVEVQKEALQKLSARLARDEDLQDILEFERHAESEGPNTIPMKLSSLAKRRSQIVAKVISSSSHEIKEQLLPHQLEVFEIVVLANYAALKDSCPLNWPSVIATDLDIDKAAATHLSKLGKDLTSKMVAKQRTRSEQVFEKLKTISGNALQDLLSTYEDSERCDFDNSDLLDNIPKLKKAKATGVF